MTSLYMQWSVNNTNTQAHANWSWLVWGFQFWRTLQPSQVVTPKWTPLAMSLHTSHNTCPSSGTTASGFSGKEEMDSTSYWSPSAEQVTLTLSWRSKFSWVTFHESSYLLCHFLSVAQFILTSATKRVFLWHRSQRDVHLFCKFRM